MKRSYSVTKKRHTRPYAVKRRKASPAVVSTVSTLSSDHRLLKTKQRVTMRYAEKVSLTGVAGGSASYIFSANGLFDPNVTGTGHQPRGFDQLMQLYDHYVVKNATCEVWGASSSNNPGVLSIIVKDNNIVTPVSIDVMENSYATHKILRPSDSEQFGMATFSVNVDKFLGGADIDERKGSNVGNPTEQCYFVINMTDIGSSGPGGTVWVKITYDVELIEPKLPASS